MEFHSFSIFWCKENRIKQVDDLVEFLGDSESGFLLTLFCKAFKGGQHILDAKEY